MLGWEDNGSRPISLPICFPLWPVKRMDLRSVPKISSLTREDVARSPCIPPIRMRAAPSNPLGGHHRSSGNLRLAILSPLGRISTTRWPEQEGRGILSCPPPPTRSLLPIPGWVPSPVRRLLFWAQRVRPHEPEKTKVREAES